MILLGLLLGCPSQRAFCVNSLNSTARALAFELGEGKGCTATPIVRRVDVLRGPNEEPVWSLFSADGMPLRTLTYGSVPPGFEATQPATPLAPGDAVVVEVKGPVDQGGLQLTLD